MKRYAFLLTAMMLAIGSTASAQDEGRGLLVDEITVTAQKREQSLQDVGISVTAVTGDTLSSLGIDDSSEVAGVIPNFNIQSITGEGNQPGFFLRGVGLNDYNTNNAGPIAIYQDGAIVSSPSAQTFALFDVQRIEVLRGPQGTLYGRNSTGGTVKFITNKPTDSLEGSISVTAGNFNLVKTEGAISGPLSDNLRARFAFMTNDADGYVTDTVSGVKYNESGNRAMRLLLDWMPTDRVSALVNLHWGEHDTIRPVYKHLGAFDASTFDPNTGLFGGFCSAADVRAFAPFCVGPLGYQDTNPNIHEGVYDRQGRLKFDVKGITVEIEADINDITKLTSITSYDELDKTDMEDSDSSPENWLNVDFPVTSETFSQELRLNIDTERSSWVVGAYFLSEDLVQNQSVDLFRDLRPLLGFDPDNFVFFSRNVHKQDTQAVALFGEAEFYLTDRVSVIAGVRYTKEDKDFNAVVTFDEPTFDIELFNISDSISEDNVTGKLALNFRPNDDVLLFGSVTTGFKSGGFPGVFGFDPAEYAPYKPEEITSFEAGFKATLADGRARLNGAAFLYDYKDLQLFQLFAGTGVPVQRLTNAADAEVSGLELELSANPTDGLYLQVGLGLLDTKLKDFQPQPGVDLSGNSLAAAPEVTANVLARYDWDLRSGSFYVQGDVTYQGDMFFDTFNTAVLTQKAYSLVGARAGYISSDDHWEASVWAKNLTDEEYFTFMLDLSANFGIYQAVAGAPNTYGATFSYRF